ncbi:MAG: Ger(x)C family spore germination protein [Firmicutes bacterium]|nr:Ger(x)C family spore germination protein [Bacillota bacterium]MCL5993279.1 Ger(x)C family spore germination protein [Bacillota bacterium]
MKRRNYILAALLACSLIFTSGCWDQVEIEDLAIVRAIAIDYLPGRRAPYLVTLAIKRPAAMGQQEGGGGGEQVVFYAGVGASIALAIEQAATHIPRRIFLTHNDLVIVGEQLAKHGLLPVLDFVVRNPDMRLSAFLLIAKGTGQELLHTAERLEGSITEEIHGLIDQAEDAAETQPVPIFRFLRKITTPGEEAYTVVIQASPLPKDKLPAANGEGAQAGEGGGNGGGGAKQEKSLALAGMAVFRSDRLAGILNHSEARGKLWLAGMTTRGIMAVDDPVHPEETVTLSLTRSQTKITPSVQAGRISFRVEVEAEGDLISQSSQADLSTAEMIEKLNSAKAGAIKVEMEKALQKMRQLETDVVGFGAILKRREPKIFREVADRWPEIFVEVPVEILVKANIRRTGLQAKPAQPLSTAK